jgi:hypothetical protein
MTELTGLEYLTPELILIVRVQRQRHSPQRHVCL